MPNDHPFRVLFVSLTNDVGSSRILVEFARHGAECAVLGEPWFTAACSAYTKRVFPLANRFGAASTRLTARRRLERVVSEWTPDRVVPVDELASHILRQIAVDPSASAAVQDVLTASLGDPEGYPLVANRGRLMLAAREIGARVPRFAIPTNWREARDAGAALGYPFVLKREYTCGGSGVAIVDNPSGYFKDYVAASSKALLKRAATLWAGDVGAPLLAQAFVPGKVAFRAVACDKGRALAGVSYVCERQHPPKTGASTIIRQIDHVEMESSAAALVQRLGCSGFVGFDFMIDGDGAAHLIEMNGRPVGSSHLGVFFGHDLVGSYLADLAGRPAPRPFPKLPKGQLIALFPRELERDPESADALRRSGVVHDAPWDDPPVLAMQGAALIKRFPDKRAAIEAALANQPDDASAASKLARAG